MPKRVKFRKTQRRRIRGEATRGNRVSFGDYGLQALERGWITAQQIEAARVAASRYLGLDGKYWIRIFPQKCVTSKPAETRMGKGKGEIEFWAAVVKPGTVLFEVGGVPEPVAREVFRRQAGKFSVKVRMLKRRAVG
ncbi:MAG: 50S ribosomal protein L16 [Planctomycetota bacterium]|jgi:large subunit ribosomal protein L16